MGQRTSPADTSGSDHHPHASVLSQLANQLSENEDVPAALAAPNLNITHLLPCSGALVSLGGKLRLLGDMGETLAGAVLEHLQAQAAGQPYCSEHWPDVPLADTAPASKTLLGQPFSRTQSGWLVWLRDAASPWTSVEHSASEALRAEVLETCLERALSLSAVQRRLISTLGHGLCNPLQSISMSAALLKPHDSRSNELRNHISTASEKMEQQINQVLEVNRLHGGEGLRLNPVRTNLSSLVASEVSRVRNSLPQLDIKASIETDIEVVVDPERMTQAVRNLLANAGQFATPGSPINLTLTCAGQTGEMQLRISNQAAMLTRAQLNSLLSATRHGATTMQRGRHLGMGLYVTQGIAKAHGGALSVQQEQGLITFQLSLPPEARIAG